MRYLALLLGTAACSQILGIDDLGGGDGHGSDAAVQDAPGPAVDCKAQRAVYLVGGEGGLAWFTLAWPAPAVITGFQPTYAYDNPALAKDVTVDPAHRLFARTTGPAHAIWEGVGQAPLPTAFVAGVNETHTMVPQSIVNSTNVGLAAAGAAIQGSLQAMVPVLEFSPGGPYGAANGAPPPITTQDVDAAIALFPGMAAQLAPSQAQLASYLPMGQNTTQVEINLATQLAFTANAFRQGLISTVMMQAFDDDPHGAFTGGLAGPRANNLATMLDAFYRDLATSSEKTCGRGGNFLSLADNTVMVVFGDTPKNSFDNNGWPDGTPGNANIMYVRSNGFLRPGWFGDLQVGMRTNFDPNTGMLDVNGTGSVAASTGAAFAGTLYAIARGDGMLVAGFTNLPFGGVIAH